MEEIEEGSVMATTIENPSIGFFHIRQCGKDGPGAIQIYVTAYHIGFQGLSRERYASELPPELWEADLPTFLNHPWTAYLIAEAKEDMRLKIETVRKDLAT